MQLYLLLDVDNIKVVINFDYSNNSEDYVHRIGRTGRRDNKVRYLIGVSYFFRVSRILSLPRKMRQKRVI
jgi:superfamily II DNA/RNA helicase